MASSADEMTIDDAWEYIKSAALAGWSRTTRKMRAAGVVLLFLCVLSTTLSTKSKILLQCWVPMLVLHGI
jgi:hypothetical protein